MYLPDDIEKPKGVNLYDFDDYKSLRTNIFDNVRNAFEQAFPASYGGVNVALSNIRYEGPEDFDLTEQKDAILRNKFLTRKLKGTLTMQDEMSGKKLDEVDISLMKVPWLTPRNTFIHGGNEYATIMQSRLLPGAYTRRQANGHLETQFNVRPGTGVGFRVGFEPDSAQYRLKISQANLHLYSLLHDIGVSDDDLKDRWGKDILDVNKSKYDARVFDKAYQRLVPTRERNPEATKEEKAKAIQNALNKVTVHRSVVSRNLPAMLNAKRANEIRAERAGKLAMIKQAHAMYDSMPFDPDFSPEDCLVNNLELDFEKQAMFQCGGIEALNCDLCEMLAEIEEGPEEFEKVASYASEYDSNPIQTVTRMGLGGLGGLGFTALLMAAASGALKKYPVVSKHLADASLDTVSILNPKAIKAMSNRLPQIASYGKDQYDAVMPMWKAFQEGGILDKLGLVRKFYTDTLPDLKGELRALEEEHGESAARTLRKALGMGAGATGIGTGAVGAELAYQHNRKANRVGEQLSTETPVIRNTLKNIFGIEKEAKKHEALDTLLAAKAHSDNKEYDKKSSLMLMLMQARPDDFVVDSEDPRFPGITHIPTKFRMHVPKEIIPEQTRKNTVKYNMNKKLDSLAELAVNDATRKGWSLEAALSNHMKQFEADPTPDNWADVVWLSHANKRSGAENVPEIPQGPEGSEAALTARMDKLIDRLTNHGSMLNPKSYVYHASSEGKLAEIAPSPSQVLQGSKAVFAYPSSERLKALSFAKRWRDDDFEHGTINNGPLYMKEKYEGAWDKIFGGQDKGGFLYRLPADGFTSDDRLSKHELIHREALKPMESEHIEDVGKTLLDSGLKLIRFGDDEAWNQYISDTNVNESNKS